jgi:hypothetical protein
MFKLNFLQLHSKIGGLRGSEHTLNAQDEARILDLRPPGAGKTTEGAHGRDQLRVNDGFEGTI